MNSDLQSWLDSVLGPNFIENVNRSNGDIFVIFMISAPLSLLLFLIFNRYRHWILVDLGTHKWLVK
jgi:hypothetical protein